MLTPPQRHALVESIHASPTQLVIAVTGGGHAIVTDLLAVAGASATVLEALVPYSPASLAELVADHCSDDTAYGAVSEPTAKAMAQACLARATQLAVNTPHLLGVGCTATIATNREKSGEHRGHISIVDSSGSLTKDVAVPLAKGRLSRVDEDRSIADVLLEHLAASVLPGDSADGGLRNSAIS